MRHRNSYGSLRGTLPLPSPRRRRGGARSDLPPALRRGGRARRSARLSLSLLELLIATALLTVVLLALFGSLFSSERLRTFTRERSAAGLKAVSMVEEVAASPWDALPARSGETFPVLVETVSGGWQLQPPTGLPRPGLVTVVDASPDLRQIRVTVRWLSRVGGEGRFEVTTLVARH